MNLSKCVLLATLTAILMVGAVSVASLKSFAIAYAQSEEGTDSSQKTSISPEPAKALGTLSSIQNDEKGQPAWVVAGGWKLFLTPSQNNSTHIQSAKLDARFIMTKLDGTSKHIHAISNFALKRIFSNGNVTTITGTATMTMKNAPQKGIPITIKLLRDNIISISFDPSVNSHLGNTPLYGTVLRGSSEYHSITHTKGIMSTSSGVMNGQGNNHDKQQPSLTNPAKSAGNATAVTIQIVSGAASMGDKAFSPSPATVKAGTEVTWKNADSAIHTVTSGKNSTPDNIFDSQILGVKKQFKFKFESAGTYDYFCQLHPTMVGQIVVE